jgi:hypothetical protein
MSVWAHNRKTRLQRPAPVDPVEDMTVRVAQRICSIVYQQCLCKQRGLNQVCDNMRLAAQHVFDEIKQ